MTASELREMLRRTQEEQGFFFNRDNNLVNDLLEGLIVNRGRYGYMCCPCRLAAGDREQDRDIICPCAY
ncbi:MAG: ferredoxin:thioredoxin reductase, partial [Nitrospiraceae bacterium]